MSLSKNLDWRVQRSLDRKRQFWSSYLLQRIGGAGYSCCLVAPSFPTSVVPDIETKETLRQIEEHRSDERCIDLESRFLKEVAGLIPSELKLFTDDSRDDGTASIDPCTKLYFGLKLSRERIYKLAGEVKQKALVEGLFKARRAAAEHHHSHSCAPAKLQSITNTHSIPLVTKKDEPPKVEEKKNLNALRRVRFHSVTCETNSASGCQAKKPMIHSEFFSAPIEMIR